MKINKEKQLKMKVAELTENLVNSNREKDRFESILEQIKKIFQPREEYTSEKIYFADLPLKIMKLKSYQEKNEGAYPIFYETVESQREIIRWLIKPSSADNSKELADIKKSMGMNKRNL